MSTHPGPNTVPNHPGVLAPSAGANLDEQADVEDLARVLVMLEDFLIHADNYLVDELAAYAMIRPDNPQDWVAWIAGLLGEHATGLRAHIPTATTLTAHQPIGEPR